MVETDTTTPAPAEPSPPAPVEPDVSTLSPQDAQAEIARVRADAYADPAHAYNQRGHPDNAALHQRVMLLHERVATDPEAAAVEPAPPASSPEGALAEIEKLRADSAYTDPKHPNHVQIHKRVLDLYGQLHPGAIGPNDDLLSLEMDAATTAPISDAGDLEQFLTKAHIAPDLDLETIKAERDEIGAWMTGARFNAPEVEDLVSAYNQGMKQLEAGHWTDDDETAGNKCMRALQSLWGDETPAKIEAANRAVAHLDTDGRLVEFLRVTGLGLNPQVIRHMSAAAERNRW